MSDRKVNLLHEVLDHVRLHFVYYSIRFLQILAVFLHVSEESAHVLSSDY